VLAGNGWWLGFGVGVVEKIERVYDCSYTRSESLERKKKTNNQSNTRTNNRTCIDG